MFRIENLTPEEIAVEYADGAIVTKKGFYSSTYSYDAIVDAARERSCTILVRIKGKNGKLIEEVSTLPKEREILFKSNTKFKVEKIGFEGHPDVYDHPGEPIKTIWLTEL